MKIINMVKEKLFVKAKKNNILERDLRRMMMGSMFSGQVLQTHMGLFMTCFGLF